MAAVCDLRWRGEGRFELYTGLALPQTPYALVPSFVVKSRGDAAVKMPDALMGPVFDSSSLRFLTCVFKSRGDIGLSLRGNCCLTAHTLIVCGGPSP